MTDFPVRIPQQLPPLLQGFRKTAALAQRHGIGVAQGSGRMVVQTVARDTAAALDSVQRQLPARFPAHVRESIVNGIRQAAPAVLDAE